MPTATPVSGIPVANVQAAKGDVRGAIARASQSTGVDFDYLLAQARLESGLNPDAKARTSSATGLYQFIDSTWLRTMDRHGSKYGYAWAGDAIGPGGGVATRPRPRASDFVEYCRPPLPLDKQRQNDP